MISLQLIRQDLPILVQVEYLLHWGGLFGENFGHVGDSISIGLLLRLLLMRLFLFPRGGYGER